MINNPGSPGFFLRETMETTIRAATGDDVRNWYGGIPGTLRAVIVEVDGEPKVIGGVLHKHGALMAFMDLKDGAQEYPVAIMRGTYKAIREIFSQYHQPIYATVNEELESAPRYLKRIGFVPSGVDDRLMVYLDGG